MLSDICTFQYLVMVDDRIKNIGRGMLAFIIDGNKVIDKIFVTTHTFDKDSKGLDLDKRYLPLLINIKMNKYEAYKKELKLSFSGVTYPMFMTYAHYNIDGTKYLEGIELDQDLKACNVDISS